MMQHHTTYRNDVIPVSLSSLVVVVVSGGGGGGNDTDREPATRGRARTRPSRRMTRYTRTLAIGRIGRSRARERERTREGRRARAYAVRASMADADPYIFTPVKSPQNGRPSDSRTRRRPRDVPESRVDVLSRRALDRSGTPLVARILGADSLARSLYKYTVYRNLPARRDTGRRDACARHKCTCPRLVLLRYDIRRLRYPQIAINCPTRDDNFEREKSTQDEKIKA